MISEIISTIHGLIQQDSGNGISRSTIHRIANVIIWNLTDTDSNNESFNPMQHNFDETVKHLLRFDRYNNLKFMEELQGYLMFLVINGLQNDLEVDSKAADPRNQVEVKSEGAESLPKGKYSAAPTGVSKSSQFVMNVFSSNNVGHVTPQLKNQSNAMFVQPLVPFISDNQELAEADQVRNTDSNGAVNSLSQTEPDETGEVPNIVNFSGDIDITRSVEAGAIVSLLNGSDRLQDIGAVGGLASSQLPDLAKVTTSGMRNTSQSHAKPNSENGDAQMDNGSVPPEYPFHRDNNPDARDDFDAAPDEHSGTSGAEGN